MTAQRFADLLGKPVLGLFLLSFVSCIAANALGARDAAWLFEGAALGSSLTLGRDRLSTAPRMNAPDPRLDPAQAHPLNRADAERSAARIADIELGLKAGGDQWFWRDKARLRVEALEDDGATYGLMPHEEAEMEALTALLKAQVP